MTSTVNITTTQTPVDNDAVLSGGIIFFIIFCATSLFFLFIMTVVCCGEFKEYRHRGPSRKAAVSRSEKETQNKNNTVGVANTEEYELKEENFMTEKQEVEQDESQRTKQNIFSTDVAIVDSKHKDKFHGTKIEKQNSIHDSTEISDSLDLPTPGRKKTELSSIKMENSTVIVADIQTHPFSPVQTVGFLDQPLPSIQETKSKDLPPVY